MDAVKKIFNSQEHVESYDQKTQSANWLGPEILFGLSFTFINSGEKLLDLGIGTGLISALFHKAGLQVYGMDFSSEMLKACVKKNIAYDLKEHDLRDVPYPYETDSMDHVVCGGVMHIFENIDMIFKDVSRIVKTGGTFAFICADHHKPSVHKNSDNSNRSSVSIYNHNQAEVTKMLDSHGFMLLKSLEFFVYMKCDEDRKLAFRAYLVKKMNPK